MFNVMREQCDQRLFSDKGNEVVSDAEAARRMRQWATLGFQSHWSWPTDGCGYEQHIRFVKHRNENWTGGDDAAWIRFVLDYADKLEGPAR